MCIRVTPLHSPYITPVGYDDLVDLLPQEQFRLLGQVSALNDHFGLMAAGCLTFRAAAGSLAGWGEGRGRRRFLLFDAR